MLRTVLAIVAGYLIVVVPAGAFFPLTGHDPHAPAAAGFVALTCAVAVAAGLAGGYVAATLARRADLRAGVGVGALVALGAAASLVTSPLSDARWSPVVGLLVMAPAAVAGAWLRVRRGSRVP